MMPKMMPRSLALAALTAVLLPVSAWTGGPVPSAHGTAADAAPRSEPAVHAERSAADVAPRSEPAVHGARSAADVARNRVSTQTRLSEHVLVVSIDGLRPDAIERFGARTLQRLMREGSYSLQATTILPSTTLPSHTSMLTGTEPEEHGVLWNREELDAHGHVATPTIFAAAKSAGFETAAFFSKAKFVHLAVPGTLDHVEAPSAWPGKWLADRTVDAVERYLEQHRPNLLFVHLAEPDFAGHLAGWMSAPYGWAVQRADRELGELLEAAESAYGAGNYTVIVTADHGGHGRGHGSDDPRDVTIPWIAWGRGVAGGELAPGIRTVDTAATALWLLGLPAAEVATGAPVRSAFTATVAASSH
jgi:predicted AlkP superfamily pyrophosphatase or phosphodiesterase